MHLWRDGNSELALSVYLIAWIVALFVTHMLAN